jgi:DNA-binding NarL/FixJ family response regulator
MRDREPVGSVDQHGPFPDHASRATIEKGSRIRVLVVEDYAPFLRFVRSALGERPELQIDWEVSNGLEAVQKAEERGPGLIVLDIGLPGLNGIEVARRVLKFAPECKIIFATQEFAIEVVQEALSLGALGYVVKAQAGSDLIAAVDAVLRGEQFVSSMAKFPGCESPQKK